MQVLIQTIVFILFIKIDFQIFPSLTLLLLDSKNEVNFFKIKPACAMYAL